MTKLQISTYCTTVRMYIIYCSFIGVFLHFCSFSNIHRLCNVTIRRAVEILQGHVMTTKNVLCKDGFKRNGQIQYRIVNKKGKVVHNVVNNFLMEWILSGDFAEDEREENHIHIQEEVFYDIDDEKFIASVNVYRHIAGTVTNYVEMRSKCKYALVDYDNIHNYLALSLGAKLVFLFEVMAMFDSGEYVQYDPPSYGGELELFLPMARSVALPVADVDKFFKAKGCLVQDPGKRFLCFRWVYLGGHI